MQFIRINNLTDYYRSCISTIGEIKKNMTIANNSALLKNNGCKYDWLNTLANPKTFELIKYIVEQQNALKSAVRTQMQLRQQIKNEMNRLKKLAGKEQDTEEKKPEFCKEGKFFVNYVTAMEFLTKMSKLVADNLPEWKNNPERKMEINFKSV